MEQYSKYFDSFKNYGNGEIDKSMSLLLFHSFKLRDFNKLFNFSFTHLDTARKAVIVLLHLSYYYRLIKYDFARMFGIRDEIVSKVIDDFRFANYDFYIPCRAEFVEAYAVA